jgi:hypothetical protein
MATDCCLDTTLLVPFLAELTLLAKIPADGQLGQVVRYSDGDNLAVSRLYDDSWK